MPKVYATTPGAVVQIDHYGPATNDQPCVVPEAVAAELAKAEGLRVEPDETTSSKGAKKFIPQPLVVEPAATGEKE